MSSRLLALLARVPYADEPRAYARPTAADRTYVAALRERWTGAAFLSTVEGNTSFGDGGSQDNGGAVARRDRSVSLLRAVVAIEWSGRF